MGTVLYTLILAAGRDPLPGVRDRFEPAPFALPALPKRLLPIEGIEISTAKPADSARKLSVSIRIEVRDVPSSMDQKLAGVAIFHTLTGSNFRWMPLNDATSAENGSLQFMIEAPTTSMLTVTLAANREHARHGYISRRTIDVVSTSVKTAPLVTLQGLTHKVRFNLPPRVAGAGPLRLTRVDDRQWLLMPDNTSGLTLRRGKETSLELSPGTYELQDPLAPNRSQQFTVPETTNVEVTASLARVRNDRR